MFIARLGKAQSLLNNKSMPVCYDRFVITFTPRFLFFFSININIFVLNRCAELEIEWKTIPMLAVLVDRECKICFVNLLQVGR